MSYTVRNYMTVCGRCRHQAEHVKPIERPPDGGWRPCADCWSCCNLIREART